MTAAEPGWVPHAVWWHVYPHGFTGADVTGAVRTPVGGFGRIDAWLDYAIELGVSGLALGPVFASSSHGYDTLDHFTLDSRLGTDADFDALVAACRARGLRILLDGVFNHVGREHPAFLRALDEPDSSEASWFAIDRHADGGPKVPVFEGHDGLVELDHGSPAVVDLVTRVMTHWLRRGVDGWRLDAAYAVPPSFWAQVLPQVRAEHPEAYVVGEVIHGDYAHVVEAGGLDSVTQYELWKALWSALEDRNLFELAHALDRHGLMLDTFVPLTFVGNHDVTRLASRVRDERHHAHALVVLFTVGGTPAVYYGDEQAFRGVKEDRIGGDDAVRPPFPPDREGLSAAGWPTFRRHQELIGLRRRHPWLHRARTRVVHLTNEQFVYEVVDADQSLRVMLNVGDVPLSIAADGRALLAGEARLDGGRVVVPGHGWAVLG